MATTRERLTEAAAQRFYRDGFRSVGLDQVLADVGISKTAFYKHFESKDDLVLAALDLKGSWLAGEFRAMVRQSGGESPCGQLRALFDVVGQVIDSQEFQGCIFVKVAMEYPLPHEPEHVAAAHHKRSLEEFVRELAREAGAADPGRMARELCMIVEGVFVTRQVTGDKTSIDVARRLAELVIEDHLAGVAQPAGEALTGVLSA
jgi:AcrR family transcriptional regulator